MTGIEAARLYVGVGARIDEAKAGIMTVDRDMTHLAKRIATPKVDVDTRNASAKLDGLKSKISGLSEGVKGGLVGAGAFMGLSAGIGMVTTAISDMFDSMVHGAARMETFTTQFEVLLGSVTEAKTRIADLTEFAQKTPFELPEVVQASKELQVLTKGALATGEGLRLVGDIASGTGMQFNEAAMWIGRMYDALQSGRPMGESLMRLQEVGAISGESRTKLEALTESVKKGAISGAQAWGVAAGEFGRFTGMMEKQSATLEGKWSNLSDSVGQLFAKIGMVALPAIKDAVDGTIALIDQIAPALETAGKLVEDIASRVNWIVERVKSIPTPGSFKPTDNRLVAGLDTEKAKGEQDLLTGLSKAWDDFFARWQTSWSDADKAMQQSFEDNAALAQRAAKVQENVANDVAEQEWKALRLRATRIEQMAGKMYDPLIEQAKVKAAQAREAMIAEADKTPGEMAAAIIGQRSAWTGALDTLAKAVLKHLSPAAEKAQLIGALTSLELAAGLKSGDRAVQLQAQEAVRLILERLIALEGPAAVAGYRTGNAYIDAITKSIAGGMNEQRRGARGMLASEGVFGPTVKLPTSPADDMKDLWKQLGIAWTDSASEGIKSGGSKVADAAKAAAEKARAAAENELRKLKLAYDQFGSFIATWAPASAASIESALSKSIKTAAAAWDTFDLAGKFGVVKAAGDALQRRLDALKLPPLGQKYAAEIDTLRNYIAELVRAADKAKTLAERETLLAKAAGYAQRINELTDLIAKLKDATDATDALKDAQNDVRDLGLALQRNAIEQQLAQVGITEEERAALQAQLDGIDAQIERNRLVAEQLQLTADLAKAQKAVTDAMPTAPPAGAGGPVEGLQWFTGPETGPGPSPTEPVVPTVSPTAAAAAGIVATPAGTGMTTTTYSINADIDFNGPTLDPYGDFAQRLAAALIPGLQRELARQGVDL